MDLSIIIPNYNTKVLLDRCLESIYTSLGTGRVSFEIIVIDNASKASIAQKKFNEIRAKFYSGYPGGLKERTLANMIEKKGFGEVFIHAIERMIPRNRLHKGRMKRLVVNE